MIKTDEFEMAEDHEEAIWIKVRDNTELRIKELEDSIIIEKGVLELAKSKIKLK